MCACVCVCGFLSDTNSYISQSTACGEYDFVSIQISTGGVLDRRSTIGEGLQFGQEVEATQQEDGVVPHNGPITNTSIMTNNTCTENYGMFIF